MQARIRNFHLLMYTFLAVLVIVCLMVCLQHVMVEDEQYESNGVTKNKNINERKIDYVKDSKEHFLNDNEVVYKHNLADKNIPENKEQKTASINWINKPNTSNENELGIKDERARFREQASKENNTFNISGFDCKRPITNITSAKMVKNVYVPLRRIVHLDLKGAPPKISYLMQLLPLMKQLGATGLLIEYEDMFPYDGPLKSIAAGNHYSGEELKSFLELARFFNLEVIPLVQTFGHLEFVLKLENFQHLRENPAVPQALCPSRDESLDLVKQMIDQIVSFHPNATWIHIGCDEVAQLGRCSLCRNKTQHDLFLQHVVRVASYVRKKYSKIPIVWDDMLHHMSSSEMRKYDLGNLVEPMMWTYISPVYHLIGHWVWALFAEVFPNVWGASAFKGAFGAGLIMPNTTRHLNNNIAWLEAMANEEGNFCEIRGLVLTGWQRYDHFATLCELLPTAVPSLAVNLLATSHGYFNSSLYPQLFEALNCSKYYMNNIFFNPDDKMFYRIMYRCDFPGNNIFSVVYEIISDLEFFKEESDAKGTEDAWMTEYNIRHNFSTIARIRDEIRRITYWIIKFENMITYVAKNFREVFDEYTVDEWIEQHFYTMYSKLKQKKKIAQAMLSVKTWPLRPLSVPPSLWLLINPVNYQDIN